jgi:hypothetical protein
MLTGAPWIASRRRYIPSDEGFVRATTSRPYESPYMNSACPRIAPPEGVLYSRQV